MLGKLPAALPEPRVLTGCLCLPSKVVSCRSLPSVPLLVGQSLETVLAVAAGEKAVPSSSLVGAQERVGLCLEEVVGMEQRSPRG